MGGGRRCWSAWASRAGSASATATSPCTSTGRGAAEGEAHGGRLRHPAGARRGDADPADGRRAGSDADPHADGWLPFQEYCVRLRQAPEVLEVPFAGSRPRPDGRDRGGLRRGGRLVICPSNPFVSIGPIVAVPGIRAPRRPARSRGVPVVAVSPLVAGRALRGPRRPDARLPRRQGERARYGPDLRGPGGVFVVDDIERPRARDRRLGIEPVVGPTIMGDDVSRASLAAAAVAAAWRGASLPPDPARRYRRRPPARAESGGPGRPERSGGRSGRTRAGWLARRPRDDPSQAVRPERPPADGDRARRARGQLQGLRGPPGVHVAVTQAGAPAPDREHRHVQARGEVDHPREDVRSPAK